MSRKVQIEEPEHHGAPRWYVGFSTLTTILMTFFITLTVSMGKTRDLGYAGPGSGAFRDAFNAHGLPGVLRGARRVMSLFTWGDKYLPENIPEDPDAQAYADRVIEMPEPDLKQLLSRTVKASEDIVLPLPLRYSAQMDKSDLDRLSAAARTLRQSDRNIMICATLPTGGEGTEEALLHATEWAMSIGRALASSERIDAARITAVGRAITFGSEEKVTEPTVTLTLRPKNARNRPITPKPRTEYEIVR